MLSITCCYKITQKSNLLQAFSLVELMVVIAIIGILSAIAVPSYKDYVVRAKVAETVSLMASFKPKIANFYSIKGTLPSKVNCQDTSCSELNLPLVNPTNYISRIEVFQSNNCYTLVTFFNGNNLGFAGQDWRMFYNYYVNNNEIITFACSSDAGFPIPAKYLPNNCQAQLSPSNC